MSKYTTELRFICEHYSGLKNSANYNNVEQIISNSRAKIFDFEYPIYSEDYRSVIETKILKHYYTREIAAETVGLWKLWLNTRLNEIMPYYNQLYRSTLIEFDPLINTDLNTKKIIKNKGTDNTQNSGNNKSNTKTTNNLSSDNNSDYWRYYSETPQGGINGLTELNYLTNATHDTNTNKTTQKSDSDINTNGGYEDTSKKNYDSTEEYIEHITGTSINPSAKTNLSQMLIDFRQTFLNIDMEIINSLNDLFMLVW